MDHCNVRLETSPEQDMVKNRIIKSSLSSPRSEDLPAVGTGITVILDALVNDLNVTVQVSLLTEHFMTFRTGCWFMYLNVEMNLRDIKLKMLF